MILLWPVVDASGLLLRRPDVCHTAIGLILLALIASILSTVTGQADYDARVAAGVDPALLQKHTDDADLVPWLLLIVLAVRVVAPRKLGTRGRWLGIGLGVALAGFIVLVGMSGGELVFDHGVGIRLGPR